MKRTAALVSVFVLAFSLGACSQDGDKSPPPTPSVSQSIEKPDPVVDPTSEAPTAKTNDLKFGDAYRRSDGLVLNAWASHLLVQGDLNDEVEGYISGYVGEWPGINIDFTIIDYSSCDEEMGSNQDDPFRTIDTSGLIITVKSAGRTVQPFLFDTSDTIPDTTMCKIIQNFGWTYKVPDVEDITISISDSKNPNMGTITYTK